MLSETPQILNRNLPFGQRQNMAGLIKNYSRTSANGQRPRAWQWLGFTPLWITLRRETFSSDVNSREFFRSFAKKSLRTEVSLLHGFLRLRSRSRRRARKREKSKKYHKLSHIIMYEKFQQGKLFFWTVPVPSVWSTVGPVPPDPVEPLCLVQLNLSLESWVHEHKFFSKLQSNDPLGGNVGAVVGAGVVGGRVGTALCGRVTHEPTVYVISSIAISPWYPFPLMPSRTIYEKKRFIVRKKIVANSITFLTRASANNHHNFLF